VQRRVKVQTRGRRNAKENGGVIKKKKKTFPLNGSERLGGVYGKKWNLFQKTMFGRGGVKPY